VHLIRLAVLFAIVVLGACSTDSAPTRRQAARGSAGKKTEDSAGGSVDLGGTGAYQPGILTAVGSVTGTVTLAGSAPLDTVPSGAERTLCGKDPQTAPPSESDFSNSVVWIANVRTGKAPPIEKRVELASEHCLLDPHVQAAVVGTAVNIFNDDQLLHKLVFTRLGTHDTLTVVPFFNIGQMVASDRLATAPGIVEVRCVQHPWTRGYLAVFDHPYFAVTRKDGGFSIDSLPPGTYTMMVWHEGALKPAEQQVQIVAGQTARTALTIAVK
jgi:hypothetical protein